jgi:hypothetical protein
MNQTKDELPDYYPPAYIAGRLRIIPALMDSHSAQG